MKLSLIILVLLWENVECTKTQKECSKLPSVEHAFVSDQYKKAEYQEGDVIYFSCDPGFTTGVNTTYMCTEHGWRAATIGQCIENTFPVALGCTPPPPLKNGNVLENSTYFYVDGQRVGFQCNNSYTMKGGPYKTCTNGQWTGDLQCLYSCDVLHVPDSIQIISSVALRQLQSGQMLQFQCKSRRQVLQGNAQVTCLENGQWSHPFPACTDPQGCGRPPALEGGDSLTSNVQFGHNERVQYQCLRMYKMQGGPFKTCYNGEWTGEIKCLKPCTVDAALLMSHNIKFKWTSTNKLYILHDEFLSVVCTPGTRHDGRVAMRQVCNDGVMNLPTCV